jgi:hypothetical protein
VLTVTLPLVFSSKTFRQIGWRLFEILRSVA